jgi:hypothetical protein
MKLELKHLVPYLPYRLEVIHKYDNGSMYLHVDTNNVNIVIDLKYKPILHPLSDLVKEITINGEAFTPMVELAKIAEMNIVNPVLRHRKRDGVKTKAYK